MKPFEAAGIVVYRRNNGTIEYLLLQHVHSGHWGFPKGGIEPGESKEHAAHRELSEEAGVTATLHEGFFASVSYMRIYDGVPHQKTVYYFLGQMDEGQEVILSHEHDHYIWRTYEDAYERLTHATCREVLDKADVFLKQS